MSDILTKAKAVVEDHLGLDPYSVRPEDKFVDDLKADSLDLIELTMAFEEEFGLPIYDEDVKDVVTVKDAADLIEKLKAK